METMQEEMVEKTRPHAVLVPASAQGHIKPMMKLAKILHHRGFHITFVNAEFVHRRLLESQGATRLEDLPRFRFVAIADGLSAPCNENTPLTPPAIVRAMENNLSSPFRDLVLRINDTVTSNVPPITCVVSDVCMSFTLDVAQELGVPNVVLWTHGACGVMATANCSPLLERGFTPLKDSSALTNGYLDTIIDWIPGMEGIRLRDLHTVIRTTDPDDVLLHFNIKIVERSLKASALVVNTFDALEHVVLDSLRSMFPNISTIGPLQLLEYQIPDDEIKHFASNLWKEDDGYVEWLDKKMPCSVLYINFGSSAHMTAEQVIEFAWGLANSKQNFLRVIRSDLVHDGTAILPPDFESEIEGRGLLISWCSQEKVLNHEAVGGFLTHCGWNSVLDSVCAGVPMICCPALYEQPTNCWFCCKHWGIGLELNFEAKRSNIETVIRDLMLGEKGREVKETTMNWKRLAEDACLTSTGSSCMNLERMINEVLLSKTKDN